jgi:hypothetical protein
MRSVFLYFYELCTCLVDFYRFSSIITLRRVFTTNVGSFSQPVVRDCFVGGPYRFLLGVYLKGARGIPFISNGVDFKQYQTAILHSVKLTEFA